jgi:hypothetical protein
MWDFVMDESGAGAGFLRELRFPLPIYIPSASAQSSSLSPEAGTIGQEWPQCQQPHKPELKKKSCWLFPWLRTGDLQYNQNIIFLGLQKLEQRSYKCGGQTGICKYIFSIT